MSLVAELENAAGGHVTQTVPGQQPNLVVRHGVKTVQQYPRLVPDVIHPSPAFAPCGDGHNVVVIAIVIIATITVNHNAYGTPAGRSVWYLVRLLCLRRRRRRRHHHHHHHHHHHQFL